MKTVVISWAYPTSADAQKHGYYNGCWIVSVRKQPMHYADNVKHFTDKAKAIAFAESLNLPFDQYCVTVWKSSLV